MLYARHVGTDGNLNKIDITAGVFMIGWFYDIVKIATGTFSDGNGLVIK